jgi:hypothetical protein
VAKASASRDTTFRVTIDAPLTAVDLPDDMTTKSMGNQTEITIRARDGRNYVARFTKNAP